jgi:hypothetical protein
MARADAAVTITFEPLPVRPLPSRVEAREARQRVAAEMRRRRLWTKAETRAFYDRLVHHDKLRLGRAVIDAISQAGR